MKTNILRAPRAPIIVSGWVTTTRLGLALLLTLMLLLAGCQQSGNATTSSGPSLKVLATTTFLADIAQNVAGKRLQVDSLLPPGVDPHGFEPTPSDVRRIADADVLIIHGQGLEEFLARPLGASRPPSASTIEASAGLVPKQRSGAPTVSGEADMHYWLDPNLAQTYVDNIEKGLVAADPAGATEYQANARQYKQQLQDLDAWIRNQVVTLSPERRLLVTDHEALGYYADRYDFRVVGAVVPSVTPGSQPSAQSLAALVTKIKETGAPAVFLEQGSNAQLAEQVARETGAKMAPELYVHYTSPPGGPAPTYIEMLKYDTSVIVQALR